MNEINIEMNLEMYLIKSKEPLMDDYYGIYFSYEKELNDYLLTLITDYNYECITLPVDIAFKNFQIIDVEGNYTLCCDYLHNKKVVKCIILDEYAISKNTVYKLLLNATMKGPIIKGKVEAYFIYNELYFNINDFNYIKEYLNQVDLYRKSITEVKVIEEPKNVEVNKGKLAKKTNGVPEKIRVEKKNKKEKVIKEPPIKKLKHNLDPFHIYRKEIKEGNRVIDEYYFVLGIVHVGYKKNNTGFFKKNDKELMLWCLNLPLDYFTPNAFRENDIIDSILAENYLFIPYEEKTNYIKMNSFKEPGNLTIEELLKLNNENLINYQPLDLTDYSTHKYCYEHINYYPLISMNGQNWLSHADYFLYIINQKYYQYLLNDYDFNGYSIIAELMDIYEEPIIDMFENWNETYRDVYKSKNINEPVSEEESLLNYAGFLAQHIIAKADERQLFFKEINATPYRVDTRVLYESIKQLMIDTEQTYHYALLKDNVTLGILEPNYSKANEHNFNIPNYNDSRKIMTIYETINQDKFNESPYTSIFNNYPDMVYFYKKRIYDSYYETNTDNN